MLNLKFFIINILTTLLLCWNDKIALKKFTLDKGYNLLEGSVSFFFLKDCLKYNFPTCFALNADSPYGLFHLPPHPSETTYKGCISKTGLCGDGCNTKNDSSLIKGICYRDFPMQWRLEKEEVILVLGITPPQCNYWSITPYLMSSFKERSVGEQKATFTSYAQKKAVSCRDGPARCAKFASLYQPYNLMEFIKNDNHTLEFSKPFAAILSANKLMSHELSEFIFSISGVKPYIFKLPTDILNMGVDTDFKDLFTMLMRVAYPSNEIEMQNYYLNPPISVYRISPNITTNLTSTNITYQQIDSYFKQRQIGYKEGNNLGGNITYEVLIKGLEILKNKIVEVQLNKNSKIQAVFHANFLKPYFTNGLDCIKQGTECNGDTPDTLYPISENIYISQFCFKFPVLLICNFILALISISMLMFVILFRKKFSKRTISLFYIIIALLILLGSIVTNKIWKEFCHLGIGSSIDLEKKDTYIIYGINHEKTNWARYSSVTAYHYEKLVGLHSASSQKEYVDSASIYLGKHHYLSQYFFAFRYSRNCTHSQINEEDIFCYEVPVEGLGSVPNNGNIFFIERMYVNPKTKTGPIYEESIPAKMIHFR
jgi:hypothetical protein